MTLSDPKPKFWGRGILRCQMTWKWYKTEVHLQWQLNTKSYMIYEMVTFFSDLEWPLTQISEGHHYVMLTISMLYKVFIVHIAEYFQETSRMCVQLMMMFGMWW